MGRKRAVQTSLDQFFCAPKKNKVNDKPLQTIVDVDDNCDIIVLDDDTVLSEKRDEPAVSVVSAVDLLLEHPTTKKLSLDTNAGYGFLFTETGKEPVHLYGITDEIKRVFNPNYVIPGCKSGKSAIKTGSTVHYQLYHMIECEQKRKGNCICTGKKTHKGRLHKLTVQALDKYAELEITVEACEVIIMSKGAERATAIDAIGKRWKGTPNERSVEISIKTGYRVGYDTNLTGKHMVYPLDSLVSCPKNHNNLQLLIEKMILEVDYNIRFDDYLTIYLGKSVDGSAEIEYLKCLTENHKLDLDVYRVFCEESLKNLQYMRSAQQPNGEHKSDEKKKTTSSMLTKT